MSDWRRLLLIAGSLLCLLVVASSLPAADPRIDVSGERPVDGATTPTADAQRTPQPENDSRTDEPTGPAIQVEEPAEPGTEIAAQLVGVDEPSDAIVTVNGDYAGRTDSNGAVEIDVPVASEMTVTANVSGRSAAVSRTVAIRTDVTVDVERPAVPGRTVELTATAGSEELSDAAVYVDGDRVGRTDIVGNVTVPLPDSAGPVDIRVERGAFEAERTVEVAQPRLTVASPVLFPGSFAVVTVTADGDPVADAPVAVNGNRVGETDTDGRKIVQLPLARNAQITTELGAESAAATAGGLYLRLTAVVVLVPGFVLGSVWTFGRLLTMVEPQTQPGDGTMERDTPSGGGADLFVLLGELLGAFADGFEGVLEAFAELLTGLGELLRRPGKLGSVSLSWPSPSLPSLGGLSLSVSKPSVGGFSRWFGSGDGPEPDVTLDSVVPGEGASERVDGRRAQIRAVWHAFLDRLDVDDRETQTAGQIARRAIRNGYRAASVRRLLAAFRAVEYGDRDPTPERVAEVRAATEDMLANDTDEEEGQ